MERGAGGGVEYRLASRIDRVRTRERGGSVVEEDLMDSMVVDV